MSPLAIQSPHSLCLLATEAANICSYWWMCLIAFISSFPSLYLLSHRSTVVSSFLWFSWVCFSFSSVWRILQVSSTVMDSWSWIPLVCVYRGILTIRLRKGSFAVNNNLQYYRVWNELSHFNEMPPWILECLRNLISFFWVCLYMWCGASRWQYSVFCCSVWFLFKL